MFVKPAGNAYGVKKGGRTLGDLLGGNAHWTIGKAGLLNLKHTSHTLSRTHVLPGEICVNVCLEKRR